MSEPLSERASPFKARATASRPSVIQCCVCMGLFKSNHGTFCSYLNGPLMLHHKVGANPFLSHQAVERRLMVFIYDFRFEKEGNSYPQRLPQCWSRTMRFMKREWDAVWWDLRGSYKRPNGLKWCVMSSRLASKKKKMLALKHRYTKNRCKKNRYIKSMNKLHCVPKDVVYVWIVENGMNGFPLLLQGSDKLLLQLCWTTRP